MHNPTNYLLLPINRFFKESTEVAGELLTIDSIFRSYESLNNINIIRYENINSVASYYRDLSQMEGGNNFYWTDYASVLTDKNLEATIDRIRSKISLLLFTQLYEMLESFLKNSLVVFFEKNPTYLNKAKKFEDIRAQTSDIKEFVEKLSKSDKNNRKLLWSMRKISKFYLNYENENIYQRPIGIWFDLISEVRHIIVHRRQMTSKKFVLGLEDNLKMSLFKKFFNIVTWEGKEYVYLNNQTSMVLINSIHEFVFLIFKSLSMEAGLNPKYSRMRTIKEKLSNLSG